jgi:hypothetical protein
LGHITAPAQLGNPDTDTWGRSQWKTRVSYTWAQEASFFFRANSVTDAATSSLLLILFSGCLLHLPRISVAFSGQPVDCQLGIICRAIKAKPPSAVSPSVMHTRQESLERRKGREGEQGDKKEPRAPLPVCMMMGACAMASMRCPSSGLTTAPAPCGASGRHTVCRGPRERENGLHRWSSFGLPFGPWIWARELRHAGRDSSVALLGRSRASGGRNPSPMHHYYSPPWAGQSALPSQVWCSLSRSLGSSVSFSPSLIPHRRPEPRTWRAPASLLLWSARAPPLACSREEESAWDIRSYVNGLD